MTKKTILLVEDNPDEAELALLGFQKISADYDIQVVANGEEALDYLFLSGNYKNRLLKRAPDLILLDIDLPKINGFEVLRRVRESYDYCHTPVAILTTSDERSDINKGYNLGVNSYLCKPTDFDSFVNLLRNVSQYWLHANRAACD